MKLCAALMIAFLSCLSLAAHAAAAIDPAEEGVDVLLDRADDARSVDPAAARVLIERLNADPRVETTTQRERLQYLDAYSLVLAGNYSGAIAAAKALLDGTTDVDTKARAGALIVNASAITRDFTGGLRQLEDTLALTDKVGNHGYLEQVYGVAATMQNAVGQYRQGRQYAERVLAMTSSPRARCFAGQSRLEAMQRLGKLDDESAARDVIATCNAVRETIVANLARATLARKWIAEGEVARAADLLQSNLDAVRATRYPALISEVESLLAECELLQGDSADAESHARAAVAQGASGLFTTSLVSAYRTLYTIAENRGDMAEAFVMYRHFAEADKAYLDEVKARELAYQIVRQESANKTQQIELLDQQNKVLELQQKVSTKNADNNRLLILLLLLLVGTVGYWAYRVKRMQLSLRYMAQSDALTEISNRHHFSEQAGLTLTRCAQAGEDVALIMFDLDHFKSINDRFGHDVGDWVLKRVAETCQGFCRRIDTLGRLGGEEFAILLTGCDLRGGNRIAEDCRVRIASIDTLPSGHKFVVTASFGVTTTSLSSYDLAKLLSHADMMLYRAKRNGRNRVGTFDGVVPSMPFAATSAPSPGRVEEGAAVYDLAAHASDNKAGAAP